jgi:hypothetical protein
MPAPFRFDRTWVFPRSPDELWAILLRTDDFQGWWDWLRRFELGAVREGATARCVIQAPLPYALHFDLHVERVVEAERIETQVTGDLRGPARLEVAPHADGCAARLVWSLELRDPVLRNVARVARPAMAWAHDRVVEMGVTQFEQRALDGRGG